METDYDKWMKSRSPRRVLIEELYERLHEAKRDLWQLCPCPSCPTQTFHPTLHIPLLPGQKVEGDEVVPCGVCKGFGFMVDWENER